jgi:hypothetical protein
MERARAAARALSSFKKGEHAEPQWRLDGRHGAA